MRAYKAADVSGDGFIERREFRLLLMYIVYFNELWDTFEEIDTDGDRRLTKAEFARGGRAVGLSLSAEQAAAEFARVDENEGGYVLFDEFCSWAARTHALVGGVEHTLVAAAANKESDWASRTSPGASLHAAGLTERGGPTTTASIHCK